MHGRWRLAADVEQDGTLADAEVVERGPADQNGYWTNLVEYES